ncbi:MAG: hypothetical protein NVS3B20_00210 [Polyangiales bacterium]
MVEHVGLAKAMASWISRHPTDHRYVLNNGYDWCWIQVDDTPFLVRAARVEGDLLVATLSDDSEERLDPHALAVDDAGIVRCLVKRNAIGGPYPAKFDQHALQVLAESLRESGGDFLLKVGDHEVALRRA